MNELVDCVLFTNRSEDCSIATPADCSCGVDVNLFTGGVAGVVVLAPAGRAFRFRVDEDVSHCHWRNVPECGPVDEIDRFL